MPALQQDRSTDLRAGQVSRSKRRAYQAAIETIIQASDAATKAVEILVSTTAKNTSAKANMPNAPSAAPAASSAAASCPRRRPDQARFSLPTNFVFLDQRGAGAEDGWESQK